MGTRHGGVSRATRSAAVLAALAVVVSMAGCSWSRLDESSGMRPVPTVPDPAATVPGVAGDGVATDPGPVTTELVGDPQPDPDVQIPLPPLPDTPVVPACDRLREYDAAGQFAAAVGADAVEESVDDQICRWTAGSSVAEVHYLGEDVIASDWFRREGIEPLGDVTADSVGIAEFVAPGSDTAAGYTIALVSRRQGAVIAVRGAPDDRAAAVVLANLVDSST